MKYWAIFFRKNGDAWQEACGDRAIIRLDGRWRRDTMHAVAQRECRNRNFNGYRLERGDSLLRLFALTPQVYEVLK